MKFGYARVSKNEQNLDIQLQKLQQADEGSRPFPIQQADKQHYPLPELLTQQEIPIQPCFHHLQMGE